MDRLTALPDEILVDIVERVRAAPPDVLPNLGFTCTRLQRLCRALLWKSVVVPWRLNKNAPIAKFLVAHEGNEDIRSMRLCPQRAVLNAFRIKMKNAHDHVDALCQCLSSLSSLDSFSIFLDGQIDRRCALPAPVLAQIVRALPPSLRHLELDTECIDEVWDKVVAYHKRSSATSASASLKPSETHEHPTEDHTKHLCHAISEHVPHLETLNLRVSCICTDLFRLLSPDASSSQAQPVSALRRALITFDVGEETERHAELHVELRDCLSAPEGPSRYTSPGANTLAKQKMFNHLLNLQAAGAFPDLQRFIVFSWHTDSERPSRYMTVRDVATRSVKKFPKLRPAEDLWRTELSEFARESTYNVRGDGEGSFLGDKRRLEKAILHEVRWREEEKGTRGPPDDEALGNETVRLHEEHLVDVAGFRQDADFLRAFPGVGGFERSVVAVDRL